MRYRYLLDASLCCALLLSAACDRKLPTSSDIPDEPLLPRTQDGSFCPSAGICPDVTSTETASLGGAEGASQMSTVWNTTDLFAGIATGRYNVFDNAGVFKETVSDGLGGFTAGCAFNPLLDRLYTTNFSATRVMVYDDASPHSIVQNINTGAVTPGGHSESVVFDAAGNFYVGHPDGNRDIHKYDAAGVFQQSFNVATGLRGSDWMDLSSDQQ